MELLEAETSMFLVCRFLMALLFCIVKLADWSIKIVIGVNNGYFGPRVNIYAVLATARSDECSNSVFDMCCDGFSLKWASVTFGRWSAFIADQWWNVVPTAGDRSPPDLLVCDQSPRTGHLPKAITCAKGLVADAAATAQLVTAHKTVGQVFYVPSFLVAVGHIFHCFDTMKRAQTEPEEHLVRHSDKHHLNLVQMVFVT